MISQISDLPPPPGGMGEMVAIKINRNLSRVMHKQDVQNETPMSSTFATVSS